MCDKAQNGGLYFIFANINGRRDLLVRAHAPSSAHFSQAVWSDSVTDDASGLSWKFVYSYVASTREKRKSLSSAKAWEHPVLAGDPDHHRRIASKLAPTT